MPGNPLVRFDEGRVGRTARCRPLSYSTERSILDRNERECRRPASRRCGVSGAYHARPRAAGIPGCGSVPEVYEAALAYELEKRGLRITRQQAIPVVYQTVHILPGFHADLVVEDKVMVEIKALEIIAPVHKKQLLTYLKLADKRLGLLINP